MPAATAELDADGGWAQPKLGSNTKPLPQRRDCKRPLEAEATPARCRRRSEDHGGQEAQRDENTCPARVPTPVALPPDRTKAGPEAEPPLTERAKAPVEDRLRATGVQFELAYTGDWLEVFDKKLEQALGDIEDADIPQEELVGFSLSITDAHGSVLVYLDSAELETSGLPTQELFSGCQAGVSAHFPLRVRFGPSSSGQDAGGLVSAAPEGPKTELPISPAVLLEQFRRNLCRKPLRLGGPVSLARVEELCEILAIGEGSPSEEHPGVMNNGFSINFVPVLLQAQASTE